ncbi:MAG: PaaI family thioesterase [Burkholderiales bacterium]
MIAIPDQLDLHRYAREGGPPLALTTNPMGHALNTRIRRADVQAEIVELLYEPGKMFMQGAGVLQGGAVSTMLDFAMAFCVLLALPEGYSCSTTNLNVNLLRAAKPGRYVAIGQPERRGRQLAHTRATLFLEDEPDRLIATATSTLLITKLKTPS